ncbi:hypothetical protein KQX54_019704 [Cotesia glomerata]|uniref:Uncharacterized protein n=1 Tax=Cotesia glomerata TaxID=32391 RepID=A0AAV7I2H6_COTGL|nr:hypothetical protein KQX54_019704 [Cotesia glomerata]
MQPRCTSDPFPLDPLFQGQIKTEIEESIPILLDWNLPPRCPLVIMSLHDLALCPNFSQQRRTDIDLMAVWVVSPPGSVAGRRYSCYGSICCHTKLTSLIDWHVSAEMALPSSTHPYLALRIPIPMSMIGLYLPAWLLITIEIASPKLVLVQVSDECSDMEFVKYWCTVTISKPCRQTILQLP